jgi:Excalibur calcium-binding domain
VGREKRIISSIITVLTIILLSGCGSQVTANKVVDALDEKDYYSASQIFEDAIEDSENDADINKVTSKAILEYLDEVYNDVESGNRTKASFVTLLNNIDEIGVYEGLLDRRVLDYQVLLDGSNLEEDSYDESYEDDHYTEDDVYYQEAEEAINIMNPYSATNIDHDCSDFDTQEDAQLFYEANGGPYSDPHYLDRDKDDMACDWNE